MDRGWASDGRQRQLIGAFFVAFETVSPVARKSDLREIVRHRRRLGSTVDDEGFAEVSAGVNSVNEPLVVDVLRRHWPFGCLSFISIGMVGIVTHHAEFGVVALVAMQLEL